MIIRITDCPGCNKVHEFSDVAGFGWEYLCNKAADKLDRACKVTGTGYSKVVVESDWCREYTRNPRYCFVESFPLPENPVLPAEDKIAVNALGGKQSDTGTRFDLVPPRAIHEVAKVLKRGAEKYGEDNWHAISTKEHLEHLIRHAYLHLQGDTSEDHLANVACRSLMALEIDRMGGPTGGTKPK